MDVLYITKTSLLDDGGGGEKRAREVVSGLADCGHDVTIISGRTTSGLPRNTEFEGCRIRHVWCGPDRVLDRDRIGFFLPRYLFPLVSLPIVLAHLVGEDYDIAVENMTPYPTLSGLLAHACRLPTVAVQHEFHGRSAMETYGIVPGAVLMAAQNLLRFGVYTVVVVPSQPVADNLTDYGVDPGRIKVIPNGVDVDRYRSVTGDPEPHALITVGRLREQKGHDTVLEAFARIHQQVPDTTLDVVGDGPARKTLEARSEALEIDDAVTFHGYVDQAGKVQLLNEAGLFLYGSRQEGYGIVLLEAMAAGLPVVARRLPVYESFFEPGQNGYLVGEPVAARIAERTCELLAAPGLWNQISSANKDTARRYSWARTVERTESVLISVVEPAG